MLSCTAAGKVNNAEGAQESSSSEPNATPTSVYISVEDCEPSKLDTSEHTSPSTITELEKTDPAKPNKLWVTPASLRHDVGRLRSESVQLESSRPRAGRPRAGSALQGLLPTAAYTAAPFLDALSNSVGDTRRHRMRITIAGKKGLHVLHLMFCYL